MSIAILSTFFVNPAFLYHYMDLINALQSVLNMSFSRLGLGNIIPFIQGYFFRIYVYIIWSVFWLSTALQCLSQITYYFSFLYFTDIFPSFYFGECYVFNISYETSLKKNKGVQTLALVHPIISLCTIRLLVFSIAGFDRFKIIDLFFEEKRSDDFILVCMNKSSVPYKQHCPSF